MLNTIPDRLERKRVLIVHHSTEQQFGEQTAAAILAAGTYKADQPRPSSSKVGIFAAMSTIADLEQELLSAMRSHDTVTLDRLIADDLLFTDHLGRHITKAWDLAQHASGRMTIDEMVASEQVVRELPKAAVVSVSLYMRGTYEQQPFEGHIRYTRFWMLRERRWQVVGGHSSLVG